MAQSLQLTQKPALLVVDMQNTFCHPKGIFASTTAAIPKSTLDPVIQNIRALRSAFHKASLPVIFVGYVWHEDHSNSGLLLDSLSHLKDLGMCERDSWDARIIDELEVKEDEGEVFVEKTRNSAFTYSKLEAELKDWGMDGLVVVGVSTNVCVESTVREGIGLGFRCVTVGDATGCMSEEEQRGSERSLIWFGGVMGTEDVVEAFNVRGSG